MRSRAARTSDGGGRLVGLVAWLLFAVCVACTVGGSRAWSESARLQVRRSFDAAAADLTASMVATLRRDTDFMATLSAVIANQPAMTNAEWNRWLRSAGAVARHAGSVGFGYTERVAATDVPQVAATLLADRPASAAPGAFAVFPPGHRAQYCFIRLSSANLLGQAVGPIGLDVCGIDTIPGLVAAGFGQALQDTASTGVFNVFKLTGQGVFAVTAPVFRAGQPANTSAQRQAALLGWVTGTFDGLEILREGGAVRPGLQVQVVNSSSGTPPQVVASTPAVRGGFTRTATVSADTTWTVVVTGRLGGGAFSGGAHEWVILTAGLAFSLLVFGFVQVLARSRQRAWRLVERKTAELRRAASHDGLTGLPNRLLIMDRIEQAISRARRRDSNLAVMFLDLDGFKAINDTFGHATGDRLLRAVASRLTGMSRDADTVGRLGGDEFVVLLEDASTSASAELVAARIRDALAEPFVLEGPGEPIRLMARASIGIAIGVRETAEELLRDADIALYEAKAAGRDRAVLFTPEMQPQIQQRLKHPERLGASPQPEETDGAARQATEVLPPQRQDLDIPATVR